MPRRKKISDATTSAGGKASPPALPPPHQNPDQIGSIKISGDAKNGTLQVTIPTPESLSRLMAAFGTNDRRFFVGLLNQIARVKPRENDEPANQTVGFLLSVVENTQPRNELEAMLLAQMATCHKMAMDLASRLNNPEEYRLFLKLMKTFADLKETFDRGRRTSEQSFMVQNMTVKDGGQAIVGNVTPLSAEPTEEQSAVSPPRLPDARAVPLRRIEESPELAPRSPVAEQAEVSARARHKNDH
jgi:hypothetical protein